MRHDLGSVDGDAAHPRTAVETRNSLRQDVGHGLLERLHENDSNYRNWMNFCMKINE